LEADLPENTLMSTPWRLFSAGAIFEVSGKDARRYLNNRLSNDIRSLQPEHSIVAAALTAQGRVEGLFTVFCLADNTFLLVADGGNRQALFASLGRFIVADRVSVQDVSSSTALLHIAAQDDDVQRVVDLLGPARSFHALASRISAMGTDIVVRDADLPALVEKLKALFGEALGDDEYDLLRSKHGYAAYPSEINSEIILTESKRSEAVSFSKGCYVGQEVIERSDAIGKVPRQLERIVVDSPGSIAAGDSIVGSDGAAIGKVVSVFPDAAAGRIFLFALLRTGKYAVGDTFRCGELTGSLIS
jgi:folate-binding protein YgfZ